MEFKYLGPPPKNYPKKNTVYVLRENETLTIIDENGIIIDQIQNSYWCRISGHIGYPVQFKDSNGNVAKDGQVLCKDLKNNRFIWCYKEETDDNKDLQIL